MKFRPQKLYTRKLSFQIKINKLGNRSKVFCLAELEINIL